MNENILKLVNLASPKLGTKIIDFSDDFFGDVSRMLNDKEPVFIEDKYGIWLIGYDGNIKDYTEDDKIFLGLFDLIDSMPMRRNEMIDEKCQ